jgi:hypothetical protein
MGFKCPVCHKDFGTNKKEMELHLKSHSDKIIINDLIRLNFNDCLTSACNIKNIIKAEDVIKKRVN